MNNMSKISETNKFSNSTKNLIETLRYIELNTSKEGIDSLSYTLSQVMNEQDYTENYDKSILWLFIYDLVK